MPNHLESFDPAPPVRAAIEMVERQYALEGIAVIAETPDGISEIRGRPVQLEQVVLNLLSNARDAIMANRASSEHAGVIRVSVRPGADPETVVIEVSDSGGGIAESVMSRLFDPFFTTKDPGAGCGLGLSISYTIVDSMGGTVAAKNVDMEPNFKGACFSVVLPRAIPPNAEMSEDVEIAARSGR